MKATLLTFALLTILTSSTFAQTPCMTISQHPSFTYDNQCDPQEGCGGVCTECRIIYVQNNTDCCVDEVNIRPQQDTCISVCGEITNPTRATWDNLNPGCSDTPKTLKSLLSADELCQGKILAFKICAREFPLSIRVDWICDGVPCAADFVVN